MIPPAPASILPLAGPFPRAPTDNSFIEDFNVRFGQECLDGHCKTLYITPGSPWENPFIESFNGTLRFEVLNRWLFTDGQEASSLGYLPPAVFAERAQLSLPLD